MVCFTLGAIAAPPTTKAVYNATKDQAAADYKTALDQCDSLTGNPKDVCLAQAKATRVHTEADAEAQYKNTASAFADVRKEKADADYDVNRSKCLSQVGTPKDVCIKQAKAILISADADAKADKKTEDARADAAEDKKTAAYKVALEKCDAYSGPTKDTCVTEAKSRFGM